MRAYNEGKCQQVTFTVLEAMKNPDEVEDCNFLSAVDLAIVDKINRCCSNAVTKLPPLKDLKKKML